MRDKIRAITEDAEYEKAIEILIKRLDEMGYENPELDLDITVDDGRKFKLKFSRVDLDS